jgi:hypothetical protein
MHVPAAAVAACLCICCPSLTVAQSPADIVHAIEAANSATAAEDWAAVRKATTPLLAHARTNGEIWQLHGRAQYYAGDIAGALVSYERVFELRHGLPSAIAFRIAQCHARLGDRERAIGWLAQAKSLGLRDLDEARSDPALAPLRSDPRFVKLLGRGDVAGLSRIEGWNLDLDLLAQEVKRKAVHPFRSRARDEVEWGALMTEPQFDAAVAALRGRLGGLTDRQVAVEIMRLLRQVGDGHTGAFPTEGASSLPLSLPLLTFDFDEGHHVVAATKPYARLLGARLIAIDGVPMTKIVAALDTIVSRDNATWVRQVAPYRLRSTSLLQALGIVRDDARVHLTAQRDGNAPETVEVRAEPFEEIWNVLPAPPDWITLHQANEVDAAPGFRRNREHYWLQHLEGGAIYFQYNKVIDQPDGEPLAKFAERLQAAFRARPAAALVVDLRWNNGGNTFLNEPILRTLLQHPPLQKRGRLVVLIGRRTYSAAMNAASYFERFFDPVFVGEPTGGKPNSAGDEVWETLPYSRMEFNVSDVLWQGGWPYDHRPWIPPDVETPALFADFRAGRDRAFEAALQIVTATQKN